MGNGWSKWGDEMKIKAELPLGNDTKGVSNNGTHSPVPGDPLLLPLL